ncbi:retron St85 family RNA-directed DNA polymerase [Undibacter mobilis]|uniref:RNA-directed DNA polymerase n=1 Tax=Undibacter mobilis TaxID=2292256 RepID=A0A371B6U5_9BRAD|nr:retron St85 family RNA-directed DNA polymerase [Undibacter mobilis]RDV03227.1 RNA-directed DNA polymerase [Undibacter mobilis]
MSLLTELVQEFGLGQSDLLRIIDTAPARYSVYPIRKRNGGFRTIAQPSREVKAIQYYILEKKLGVFPVHPSAMAYVKGRNIRQNAASHASSGPILKLDFQEFFPSIGVRDWERFVKSHPVDAIDLSDLKYYSKILFWGQHRKSNVPKCLSIGAPTSPIISNILLYDLDVKMSALAELLGVVYSRYADDITVSGQCVDEVLEFERLARREVKSAKSPKLTFNEEKRGLYFRGQRRLVTGLVLTPTERVSLGRKRKRTISSLLHKSTLGQLDPKRRGYLKGLLGFSVANEPEFLGRLRRKYGDEAVNAALVYFVPKRIDQEALF